eukprot:CAMPEP_0118637430 /NCGR_PEP_ID=MMETSP0785-20121206/3146_1 /TAXON_ID=91992 /ORGANISM="Bolidomonas pacifica, Strain CCMP 1866" /LENGTH=127 /DNA_ID=CAMNT_0006528611 /DNA_START=345 /DNA_END=727 /DNA_ORIENTATION=-
MSSPNVVVGRQDEFHGKVELDKYVRPKEGPEAGHEANTSDHQPRLLIGHPKGLADHHGRAPGHPSQDVKGRHVPAELLAEPMDLLDIREDNLLLPNPEPVVPRVGVDANLGDPRRPKAEDVLRKPSQ